MRESHGGKGKKLFGSRLDLGRETAGRADEKGQFLPLIAHGGDFSRKRFGRTALPLYRERDDMPLCGAQNVGSFLGERGAFGKFADVERTEAGKALAVFRGRLPPITFFEFSDADKMHLKP